MITDENNIIDRYFTPYGFQIKNSARIAFVEMKHFDYPVKRIHYIRKTMKWVNNLRIVGLFSLFSICILWLAFWQVRYNWIGDTFLFIGRHYVEIILWTIVGFLIGFMGNVGKR